MRLVELFDKPGKWQWISKNAGFASAAISIDKLDYHVMIEKEDIGRLRNRAGANVPKWVERIATEDETVYSIEFEFADLKHSSKSDDMYGITGTGSQFRVFATVMGVMKEYSQKYNVD